jgi:hypothetical protein
MAAALTPRNRRYEEEGVMGLFSAKQSKRRASRVVATGKRVKGTWVMESRLSPKPTARRTATSVLSGENRRVRTLH